ncbi:MAG TPA: IPT/TIG domain-containing protein [Terracidiphilus sp.]|nr:IPT/TIG domain-containing protein [Terracidiphilus sp.]
MRIFLESALDWDLNLLRLIAGDFPVDVLVRRMRWRWVRIVVAAVALLDVPGTSPAGGPKYVAGASFFDPAVMGEPVRWPGGAVQYFVDQGPLSDAVSNQQATAMVDAAAALWSAVPTAGVTLTDAGTLNEDVSGANVVAGNGVILEPADVAPGATAYPVGVIFDADGSVINRVFGAGASDATSCQNNAVWTWIDNMGTEATIAHAVIVLNGLCAATADQLEMMSFELERAFGEVLGLGFSQVNPGAFTSGDPSQVMGLPVMEPLNAACGTMGGACIPNPNQLRWDDIAELNRLYPITAGNLADFPGKELTAANTISIDGVLTFRNGTGMQGVNVVARPMDANGNPLYQYTATFVSGGYFNGNHGNAVTGWTDANGTSLTKWGSNNAALQGYFDLRYLPLPPDRATADYEVTFEPVGSLYIGANAVGPYVAGSPAPSGTTPVLHVTGMSAGSSQTVTVNVEDSAVGGAEDAIGEESSPRMLPPSGTWRGRLSQIGQTDWFLFPVRGGHTFTVVTEALNGSGEPSESKAMPAIGAWNALDVAGSAPETWGPGLNGYGDGESFLSVQAGTDSVVRLGIADMRGDGRPDYAYSGWVLCADTVAPQRLPAGGGPIVIQGMGFRPSDTVRIGGQAATVTSVSPNEITAIAPAAQGGATGSVDVEVDDLPVLSAMTIVPGGVSYDAGTGDSLTLVTAPTNTVPIGVPIPFTVTALGANLAPAGGVTVTFSVTSGSASLGCGQSSCAVTATGDGMATMTVTGANTSAAVVVASLTNGASVQAHFVGGTAPAVSALTPSLSVAAGASVTWTTAALVLQNGTPLSGQTVTWQPGAGISIQGGASAATNSSGIATKALTVGPLAEGQQTMATACVNGTTQCARFGVLGARPEYAFLEAVSGTEQTLAAGGTPELIALRLRDMDGNPLAGGTVTLFQAVYAWTPPCPPHGRCSTAELLAIQTAASTSAIDGSVLFTPASLPGLPVQVIGVAATGNASALSVSVEEHP